LKIKRVLLLASKGSEANRIAAFCRKAFAGVDAFHGDWGQPLPEECGWWRGDLIVSYCSRWIVPAHLLERAEFAAINFHPGPPECPGVGGLNWALYNDAGSFGVTCHRMAPKVDTGPIIAVRRFPVIPSDDVESLFARTHLHLEALAYDILGALATGAGLPSSSETWSGPSRTRRELDELATITPEMSPKEIARRVRATSFGNWQPAIRLGQFSFELKKSQ
jgi:methionyl-tRNA formyltransferase